MTWNEPALYIAGILMITFLGCFARVRLEGREDHIVVTLAAGVSTGILGVRGIILVWVAAIAAAPFIVGWNLAPAIMRREPAAETERRAAVVAVSWLSVTALSVTFGFALSYTVYNGLWGAVYPIPLRSTREVLIGAIIGITAWIGTMIVRIISQRAAAGSITKGALDPIDSVIIPYLLPLIGGFPIITACIALYVPDDPWPSLIMMCWCAPVYAATAIEVHRRRVAQELRRDALAKQRLAAIGEISARIVHQSRHQVGLIGWSIHRLRGIVANVEDTAIRDSMLEELRGLADAKEQLGQDLASDLLHEPTAARGPESSDSPHPPVAAAPPPDPSTAADEDSEEADVAVADVIRDVANQLQLEADREGVSLVVELGRSNGAKASPQLRDVVFNLVDNAIDAASTEVVVRLDNALFSDHGAVITIVDDGPGLPAGSADRVFEPFFTTKADGTGMGLAIVDALVGDLGGELSHERAERRTTFRVTLPH